MKASAIHALPPERDVVELAIMPAAPLLSSAVPSVNEAAIATSTSQSMLLRAVSIETQRVAIMTAAATKAAKSIENCGKYDAIGASGRIAAAATCSSYFPDTARTIAARTPMAS